MAMTDGEVLRRATAGFAAIDLGDELKQSALAHLEDWLGADKFQSILSAENASYRPLLEWMATNEEFDLLLDSFYRVIPFGTGGRRGPVGIGPNRINPYTIASSVQGHVEYLRRQLPDVRELKVIVAYDVRCYQDLRGIYPPEVPNPLLGISSKDFAHIAASVYCAGGVGVFMLPDELNDYLSTPELSFLIRHLGAHGGLNVSASHNHPDDNGGKFYNASGGQEIPPHDERMVKIVETIREVTSMPYEQALASGMIRPLTDEHRRLYIDLNLRLRLDAGAYSSDSHAKIVYTPLHGTGRNTVGRCLQQMGFRDGEHYFTVEQQYEYRGDFAHVKFRTPNPEVPESMESAVELAGELGADLVLATDPDADRIGACAPAGDGFAFINGNELAAIVTRYRLESLRRAGKLPEKALVIKTQVTTELMSRIARSFGAQVIGDLLVGFKYVGDILDQLETVGRFREVEASVDDFVVAAEESHGLLLTPHIHDKDAAGAAVVLAELVSELKREGKSLHEYLTDTYKRFGYSRNLLRSTIMQGAAGNAAIGKIQQELRAHPPQSIAGLKVMSVLDYWDESRFGPILSETDRGSRNLLTMTIEGGLRATIRPSGTEPKNKIYIEQSSEPVGAEASDEEFQRVRERVDREVVQFSNAFLNSMLEIIDVRLPDYALEISDLVSLENKLRFAETFVPEFRSRCAGVSGSETDREQVNAWIDQQLAAYGADARLLVAKAMRSYLAAERTGNPAEAALSDLQEELFF